MYLRSKFMLAAMPTHLLLGYLARLFNDLACCDPGTQRYVELMGEITRIRAEQTVRKTCNNPRS